MQLGSPTVTSPGADPCADLPWWFFHPRPGQSLCTLLWWPGLLLAPQGASSTPCVAVVSLGPSSPGHWLCQTLTPRARLDGPTRVVEGSCRRSLCCVWCGSLKCKVNHANAKKSTESTYHCHGSPNVYQQAPHRRHVSEHTAVSSNLQHSRSMRGPKTALCRTCCSTFQYTTHAEFFTVCLC